MNSGYGIKSISVYAKIFFIATSFVLVACNSGGGRGSSVNVMGSSSSGSTGGNEFEGVLAPPGTTTGSVEIEADEALAFVDENTVVTVEAMGFERAEGPVWYDAGGYLLFSDVHQNRIYKLHPTEGLSTYLRPSGSTGYFTGGGTQGSNGLQINASGELILMQAGDRRVAKMSSILDNPTPVYETLVDTYQNGQLNAPNDAVIHSNGDIYFTDPIWGSRGGDELGFTGVYRLTPGNNLFLLDDQYFNPNGIGLSPTEDTLYVGGGGIMQYDLSPDGEVSNKRGFADLGGIDGFAVHSSGVIFSSSGSDIVLIQPDGDQGRVIARIKTGGRTANCTLADNEKTLYIAAASKLLSVKLK